MLQLDDLFAKLESDVAAIRTKLDLERTRHDFVLGDLCDELRILRGRLENVRNNPPASIDLLENRRMVT